MIDADEGALVADKRTVLVTGSCGLIGSEVTRSLAKRGFSVTGIDSNHRAVFFDAEGDTRWVLGQLKSEIPGYRHEGIDQEQSGQRKGELLLDPRSIPNE